MGRLRKRSGSANSWKEMVLGGSHNLESSKNQDELRGQKVRNWMKLLLTQRQADTGKSLLLHGTSNHIDLPLLAVYLIRTQQLDAAASDGPTNNNNNNNGESMLQTQLFLEADAESRYTALHWALYRGDLATILLLLRHASQQQQQLEYHFSGGGGGVLTAGRMKQRPMALLEHRPSPGEGGSPAQKERLWETMVTARDAEGYTPGQLLASMQKSELRACRESLPRQRISPNFAAAQQQQQLQPRIRQSSFDIADEMDADDELGVLNHHLRVLRQQRRLEELQRQLEEDSQDESSVAVGPSDAEPAVEYGCELMTFGRAHHCALGVGADMHNSSADSSSSSNSSFRPQRVQAFAQSEVGRANGAVAVAASTHHTMVMTKAGKVFTFGLGKGGRLGTGTERHCHLPTLVPLGKRRVVAIAAAENHSLAVTSLGQVWAWGSNRFGQLGIPTMTTGGSSTSSSPSGSPSCVLIPRRVDDLKDVVVCAVAAGERHSVALSNVGTCYVWGDNSAGQLGLPPRRQHNAKVQMVQALSQKTTVAIAASDYATLALTLPPRDGSLLPINAIYSWGHGNHVPAKVHLQERGRARSNSSSNNWDDSTSYQQHHRNLVSPISIACAKYHNVAITQNGLVYTWGFHAETLGTPSVSNPPKNKKHSITEATTPQLVEGMLPENGGGLAVAVAASENHTAVLTDTGALYTWGATHGPNILGHEGVRWQPDPKKVPGLYRGVAVAAAKEHICVLVGASFPTAVAPTSSLEDLAAQSVAKHVDLFNVLPILTTAERAQNEFLIRHCLDFCKRNMDGVLNVGERSVMDCYLTEQLQTHVFPTRWDDYEKNQDRDARCHPILKDFGVGGRSGRMVSLYPTELPLLEDWMDSCVTLMESLPGKVLLQKLAKLRELTESSTKPSKSRANVDLRPEIRRARAISFGQDKVVVVSKCSFRCTELVQEDTSKNEKGEMNKSLLEERQRGLMKEVRAIRKRLLQITKLEEEKGTLSAEQQEKLSRKEELEADLSLLEPALSGAEQQLRELAALTIDTKEDEVLLKGEKEQLPSTVEEEAAQGDILETSKVSFGCQVCGITCSDKSSFSLHMNGRKHRNRLGQVKQEEQERTAALVAAQHQREMLKKSTQSQQTPKLVPSSNPWKSEAKSPVAQPAYKLPPPPHGVPSSLVQPSLPQEQPQKSPLSLKDIMASEERKSMEKKSPSKPKKIVGGATRGITPVVGSLPQSSNLPNRPRSLLAAGTPAPEIQATKIIPTGSSSWTLKVDSLPALESPPWAQPVARVAVAQPSLGGASFSSPSADTVIGSSPFSLSDYKGPPGPPPKKHGEPKHVAGSTPTSGGGSRVWGSPQVKCGDGNNNVPSPAKFVEIQDEEMAFKEKQDPASCGENKGKWFMEQRQKASSLKEIQESAEKERLDRLMIEEQFRIEKMILEDIERQKKKDEEKNTQKGRGSGSRRKPKKQPKGQGKKDDPSPRKGKLSSKPTTASDDKLRSRNNKPKTPSKPKEDIQE